MGRELREQMKGHTLSFRRGGATRCFRRAAALPRRRTPDRLPMLPNEKAKQSMLQAVNALDKPRQETRLGRVSGQCNVRSHLARQISRKPNLIVQTRRGLCVGVANRCSAQNVSGQRGASVMATRGGWAGYEGRVHREQS